MKSFYTNGTILTMEDDALYRTKQAHLRLSEEARRKNILK